MPGPPEIDIGSVVDVAEVHAEFASWVLAQVDGLDAAIRGLREPTLFTIAHAVGRPDPPPWVGAVANQLNNDLTDLVQDAICGRGRPAIRTARSLFDHLLTVRDVTSSAGLAERYERHRWVVWRDALRLGQRTQRGSLTRTEAHRQRVNRREVEPRAQAALNDYGTSFRRDWNSENRWMRAERYGLEDDYEWYRLASAILHGSAGGVLGTYAEFGGDGPHIHRTGSALSLAPDALEWGLRWSRLVFDGLTPEVGEITTMMTTAITRLETFVPAFRQLVEEHDRTLWFTNPTHLEALLMVTRWPSPRRWYLRIAGSNWVRPAIEPSGLTAEQAASLDELVASARGRFPVEGDCVTIHVQLDHRRIFPVPDREWTYSPQMFQQPSLRWDDPSQPRGMVSIPYDVDGV